MKKKNKLSIAWQKHYIFEQNVKCSNSHSNPKKHIFLLNFNYITRNTILHNTFQFVSFFQNLTKKKKNKKNELTKCS